MNVHSFMLHILSHSAPVDAVITFNSAIVASVEDIINSSIPRNLTFLESEDLVSINVTLNIAPTILNTDVRFNVYSTSGTAVEGIFI